MDRGEGADLMAAATDGLENLEDMIVRQAEATGAQVAAAKAAIGNVIFGQDPVVEQALITVLCGGHALLIGLPGLAKTKLVETMGVVLGLDARRIQFTPDLMPSDIVGSEVLDEGAGGKRSFRFIAGPIFAQLLMADEINRASPRTQSALLQAMQEHHVTVAGNRHDVPRPFHVLATQNPIEQEGTYPLPEAQLDRFLMQIDVGYPDHENERKIVFDTTGTEESKPKPTMTADELLAAQRLVRRLPVGESVVEAILNLVRSARPGPDSGDLGKLISWGPSPRASQALMLVARSKTGGAGGKFLAVSPLFIGRAGAPGRLAALRPRRTPLCARAGMGGRAYGMAVAGSLAVDAVHLAARAGIQARSMSGRRLRARRNSGASGGTCRYAGSDAAHRQPQRAGQDRERDRP